MCPQTSSVIIFQDINFWGSAYGTYFAIPYLKQTKGKIIVVASAAGWLPPPRMSFYNVRSFFSIRIPYSLSLTMNFKQFWFNMTSGK